MRNYVKKYGHFTRRLNHLFTLNLKGYQKLLRKKVFVLFSGQSLVSGFVFGGFNGPSTQHRFYSAEDAKYMEKNESRVGINANCSLPVVALHDRRV